MMKKELLLGGAALLFAACGGEEAAEEVLNDVADVVEEVADEEGITNEFAEFEFELTIANLPSPVEYISVMAHHENLYNEAYVVPLENADHYISSSQQAIGFGMYMSDLAYMAETEHTETLMSYFSKAHELATELGAAESFDRIISGPFEDHSHDKDSLNAFVHQGYMEIESYLTNDARLTTASELLVGSWIECQYIITHVALTMEDGEIRDQLLVDINDQKLHLNNLVDLMNAINDEALLSHITEFENLKELYHSFPDATELTPEILEQINAELETLRSSLI